MSYLRLSRNRLRKGDHLPAVSLAAAGEYQVPPPLAQRPMPFRFIMRDLPVAKLVEQLARNPDLWLENDKRRVVDGQLVGPHTQCQDIWVRFNDLDKWDGSSRFLEPHESVWYPCIDKLSGVHDVVEALTRQVPSEALGGILIIKLPAWGKVDAHVDHGWHAAYYDKFYVSLTNGPGTKVGFKLDGQDSWFNPLPGECYQFRNDIPHWVDNDSECVRISMIVCLRPVNARLRMVRI